MYSIQKLSWWSCNHTQSHLRKVRCNLIWEEHLKGTGGALRPELKQQLVQCILRTKRTWKWMQKQVRHKLANLRHHQAKKHQDWKSYQYAESLTPIVFMAAREWFSFSFTISTIRYVVYCDMAITIKTGTSINKIKSFKVAASVWWKKHVVTQWLTNMIGYRKLKMSRS